MTAVLAILLRFGPYIVAFAIGILGGYKLEEGRYASEKAAHLQDQLAYSQSQETAQKAANEALQKQIQARLDTEARNGQIISQLQAARDNTAAERDFAYRLLAAAKARSVSSGAAVSKTFDQSRTPAAPDPPGDRSLAIDVADAAADARQCFRQYRALLDELTPQLAR